jgi:hypothetical protein
MKQLSRFLSLPIYGALIVVARPLAAETEYEGLIEKLFDDVRLEYAAVKKGTGEVVLQTKVWVDSDTHSTTTKADIEFSSRLVGRELHWRIATSRLVRGDDELTGAAPVIEINRVTDTRGHGISNQISFPLYTEQGRPQPRPGSALYRFFNTVTQRQLRTMPRLSDKPLKQDDKLYEMKAQDIFALPLPGLNAQGGIEGRILGATQFQGRPGLVVGVSGGLTLKSDIVDLTGEISGYRILDRKSGLPLKSLEILELNGTINGKKGGIILKRSVSITLN